VNEDRVYHWMSQGAQPSESVVKLFRSTGLLDRYARFKQGEAMETLLAEANAAVAASPVSSKTSTGKPSK
jgi:small subunit ribosomal protein S16